MPTTPFDSLASDISSTYTPGSTSEDTMGGSVTTRTGETVVSGTSGEVQRPGTATTGTTGTATGTAGTTTATTTSAGEPAYGSGATGGATNGTTTGTTTGTNGFSNATCEACQQCALLTQQDNDARETVCATMKDRVESWFYENGCPIQIISLPSQQQSQSPCMMQMMNQMQIAQQQQYTGCQQQQPQQLIIPQQYSCQQQQQQNTCQTCGM